MGTGLGPQGKLERLCVGSFNNCFGKFVPFLPNNGSRPRVLRCVIIMECPTWVWDNICSTHYWPQRTKQVEQQSQGKRQWINDGLVLFTTSQMSSFIATIWAILFINTFSINLEIASCSPRMITVFWRSFNLFSWGVHYSVFVVKGKLRVTLNYEEYEDKPTQPTPVLHNASFFSFKRTACLRGQTRLQRQYRLFSFLLLWAAVLLSVLNLLQNFVHLRLWGGPQLCAESIRDLSTLAHAQQLTDWQLFSRPRSNEWEKYQFCVTIGDLTKNLY